MKVDPNSHFAHPVLTEANDDYLTGEFDLEIEFQERGEDVELGYSVKLTSSDMRKLLDAGEARAGAFVRCQDTFYSGLLKAEGSSGVWHFPKGSLYGKVEVKPFIWLAKPLDEWAVDSLNSEYGTSVSIREAEIIALAGDFEVSIGQDKLQRFESIFELVLVSDLPGGKIEIDLSSDAIRILAPSELYQSIEQLRGTKGGKAMLLSAVYMPVVMEVLGSIRGERNSGYEGSAWYRVFSAKCQHLNIDIQNPSLLEDAQKLLDAPISKLGPSFIELVDYA